MGDRGQLVLKLLIFSAILSGVIKYVLPTVQIPDTTAVVLLLVLMPSILLAAILLWRGWRFEQKP
jgi:membrane protein YdbS with pleckstrin-like domain